MEKGGRDFTPNLRWSEAGNKCVYDDEVMMDIRNAYSSFFTSKSTQSTYTVIRGLLLQVTGLHPACAN